MVALVLHEFFHFVALYALGGEGYITFSWAFGFTHFTEPPSHIWIVHLSGGLFTGVFLLAVFWIWAWSSRSRDNTGMEAGAFVWAAGSLAYAPVEVITGSPVAAGAAFGLGFTVATGLYFVRLMNWFVVPETR